MFSVYQLERAKLTIIVVISLIAAALPGCGLLCRRGQIPSTGSFGDEAGVEALDAPDVRRLDGGLTTVTLRDERSSMTAVQLWMPNGSADEPQGAMGFAEICAARLCEGLPTPAGISLERWATFDATVCEFEAPRSLSSQLARHVGALLRGRRARGGRSIVEASCRDAEERWRRSRSEPHRLASEILFQTAFGEEHPYGQPILSPPSCDAAGADRIAQVCDDLVDISRLTVTSVGAGEPDELHAALSGVTGERRRRRDQRTSPQGPITGPRTSVVSAATSKSHVAIGFRFETLTDVERADVEIILRILEERVKRRVARAPGPEGDEPEGFVFAGRDGGLLALIVDARPADAVRTVWEVLAEARALGEERPTEGEVGRARIEALRAHQQARFGATRLARALGYDTVVGGDATFGAKLRKAISKASVGELREAASIRLAPEKLAAAVILPEASDADPMELPTIDDGEGRERLDVERLGVGLASVVADAFARPQDACWEHLAGGVDRSSGTKGQTLLVSREPSSSLVAVRAAYPLETAATGSASAGELASELRCRDPSGVTSGITIRERGRVLAVEGLFLRHHVAAGIQVVIGALLDRARLGSASGGADGREGVLDAARDPLAAGRLAVERAFDRTEPGAVPTGGRPGSEHHDGPARTAARLNGLVVTVVGPVDPEEVFRAMESSTPPPEGLVSNDDSIEPPGSPPPRSEVRQTAEIPRTHLWLAFPTRGIADPRRHEIEVLAALLDAPDGRLRRPLVGAGLAFDASVELWHDARRGVLALHATTSRTNEAATRRTLREVLDTIQTDTLTDAEIDAARRIAAAKLAREVSTASARAAALELAQLAGIEPAVPLESEARALGVTASDAVRLARELFDPSREVVVVVGPETSETAP
jgi:zinc protease